MKRAVPITHYVYEFSYPEGMPELAGVIFYVGKGTSLQRMNNHLDEAASGCDCRKCEAICSIWDANLVVVRRIVFETLSEDDALQEEQRRILLHQSPFLTNIQHVSKTPKPTRTKRGNEADRSLWSAVAYLERLDNKWENHRERWQSQESDIIGLVRQFARMMRMSSPSKSNLISFWEEQKIQEYQEM